MKITKLQLKNFRKFANLEMEFSKGFNVVHGPNEQGKSTIVRALIAGLFFDPLKKPSADVLENQRWGSDQLYSIVLDFEADGNAYQLTKDFQNKFLQLREDSGNIWKTFPEVSKKMSEFSGLSTPTLYESSVCIRQDKVAQLHASKAELARVLQELVTSDEQDVNVLQLVRALNREIQKLRKGIDRDVDDPGALRRVQDELQEKQARFQELSARSATISAREAETKQAKTQLLELQKKEAALKDLLLKNKEQFEAHEKLSQVITAYTQVNRVLDALEKLTREKQELVEQQKNKPQWNVAEASQKIQKLVSQAAVLESKEKDLSKKSFQENYVPVKGRLDTIYFALAGVFVLVGLAGFFRSYLFVGFLPAIIFVVLGVTSRSQKQKVLVDVSGFEKEKVSEVAALKQEIEATLKSLGVANIGDAQKVLQEVSGLTEAIQDKQLQIQTIETQYSKDDLVAKREDLAVQKIGYEKMLRDLGGSETNEMQLMQRQREFEEMTQDIRELHESIRANEAVIESMGFSESEFDDLESGLLELKKEQARVQSQMFIYTKIRDTLEVAQTQTMGSVRDILQETIQEYLPLVTNDRYQEVRVGDALEVEVFSKEKGDFVNPKDDLSQGTIDQIYVIARFALAMAQSEGKYPPFILDDPFVTFDRARKEASARLVKELAKDFQIFLFSYSSEYNEFADRSIELEKV